MNDLIDRQMLKADLLCGDNAEHDYCFPCKKILERIDNQPAAQPEGRSGVFIPDITVEMFRNASLEGVEDLMASGEMEDISLPSAQSTMGQVFDDDCVSRQKAIDELLMRMRPIFATNQDIIESDAMIFVRNTLESLPSAQPERKTGKFIGTEYDGYADGNPVYYEWKCSECGCIFEDEEPTFNFCPNCGADMRGEQE